MVHGCEKRIYYVKNTGSEIFDEAYLILRRGGRREASASRDMEAEARRIVSGAAGACPGRGKVGERLKLFIAGAASSAGLLGMAALVLYILG